MATIKIIYRQRKLSNGNYPLFLRIAHLKTPAIYIRLKGYQLSRIEHFDKSLGRYTPKKPKYKELNVLLTSIEKRADSIAMALETKGLFIYERFKNEYLGLKDSADVITAYNNKIASLHKLGKEGTALAYEASKKAISKFIGNKQITFNDITYSFLKDFEETKRLDGSGGTNISFLLRSLRALHYDYCKRADIPHPTTYIKFNIQRLSTKTAKRALSSEQFKRLLNYTPVSHLEALSKDMFMFSFFARGMNLMDIAGLKTGNIKDGTIIYKRSKTSTPFIINISDNIQRILDKSNYGGKYLFPIIRKDLTLKKSVTSFNHTLNKQLKNIADKVDLPDAISMIWARHSWATLAQKNGVSIEKISAGLGHSDLKTTQIYLARFENKELDDITNDIINGL